MYCHQHEGHSEIIDIPPPFPNENERLIHQLEIQSFQGVHCRGWIILQTVWTKTGRKEKSQLLNETPM